MEWFVLIEIIEFVVKSPFLALIIVVGQGCFTKHQLVWHHDATVARYPEFIRDWNIVVKLSVFVLEQGSFGFIISKHIRLVVQLERIDVVFADQGILLNQSLTACGAFVSIRDVKAGKGVRGKKEACKKNYRGCAKHF